MGLFDSKSKSSSASTAAVATQNVNARSGALSPTITIAPTLTASGKKSVIKPGNISVRTTTVLTDHGAVEAGVNLGKAALSEAGSIARTALDTVDRVSRDAIGATVDSTKKTIDFAAKAIRGDAAATMQDLVKFGVPAAAIAIVGGIILARRFK